MRRAFSFVLLGLAGAAFILPQTPKKKITRAADVPQFSYPINGKVEDLLHSDEAFTKLTAATRRKPCN